MKKQLLILSSVFALTANAQTPLIDEWILNENGKMASYWEGSGMPITYTFYTTTDSADVLKVCYTTNHVFVRSHGMTNDMGQYLNPGSCEPQDYTWRFPRTPVVPVTKISSPYVNALGVLLNGIPIYGLTNSYSYNGSTNVPNGTGVWNVEVYMSEGFVLDTAFAAHPQQSGAYHSHATPFRFYASLPTNQHSPLVGFAFDGYPVYGPYGYSTAMNSSSGVTRMKTGYSLRNITTRTILPDGSTASQTGPAVNGTYPIGTYVEDYEWLSANGGDLDEHNGRFCVTPEYPSGTYAYFVTMDAAGNPEFPYYVGTTYYGTPESDNYNNVTITVPGSATCILPLAIEEQEKTTTLIVYPNPNNGIFTISVDNNLGDLTQVIIYNLTGEKVYASNVNTGMNSISLSEKLASGLYMIHAINKNGFAGSVQKIVVE